MPTLQVCPYLIWKHSAGSGSCYSSTTLIPSRQVEYISHNITGPPEPGVWWAYAQAFTPFPVFGRNKSKTFKSFRSPPSLGFFQASLRFWIYQVEASCDNKMPLPRSLTWAFTYWFITLYKVQTNDNEIQKRASFVHTTSWQHTVHMLNYVLV